MTDYRKEYEKEIGRKAKFGEHSELLKYKDWLESSLSEAESQNKNLVEYTQHKNNCDLGYKPLPPGTIFNAKCTCGLDELLKTTKEKP